MIFPWLVLSKSKRFEIENRKSKIPIFEPAKANEARIFNSWFLMCFPIVSFSRQKMQAIENSLLSWKERQAIRK